MGCRGLALFLQLLLLSNSRPCGAVTDVIIYESVTFSNSYGCDQLMALPYEAKAFTSPGNFPINYPNNADVCWVLEAYNTTYDIYIEPIISNTESLVYVTCEWADYVQVRNGGSPGSPLLSTWCGAGLPGDTFNTSNKAYISFRSDGRVNAGGFQIKYWAYIHGVWLDVDDPFAPEPVVEETVTGSEPRNTSDPAPVTSTQPTVGASTSDGGLSGGIQAAIAVGVIAFVVVLALSIWQIHNAYQRTKLHYQRKAYNAQPDAYGHSIPSKYRSRARSARSARSRDSREGSIKSGDGGSTRKSRGHKHRPRSSRPKSAQDVTGMTSRGTILVTSNVPDVETAGTRNDEKRRRARRKTSTTTRSTYSGRSSGQNSMSSSQVSLRSHDSLTYELPESDKTPITTSALPEMEEEHDNPAFLQGGETNRVEVEPPKQRNVITVASDESDDIAIPEPKIMQPPAGRLPPLQGKYGSMGNGSSSLRRSNKIGGWLETTAEVENEDEVFHGSQGTGIRMRSIPRAPNAPLPSDDTDEKPHATTNFDSTVVDIE